MNEVDRHCVYPIYLNVTATEKESLLPEFVAVGGATDRAVYAGRHAGEQRWTMGDAQLG
ncbi:MAG: hypothetical protein ROW52_09125 [Anaerolineaceae bacterium]|jgi:hypothetical protein